MKQIKEETRTGGAKIKQAVLSPPPPPPLPRSWVSKSSVPESVTKKEIAKFWKQKRIVEEEHLLAAIKSAARVKARNLSEEDYRLFEESLEDEDTKEKETSPITNDRKENDMTNEIRVGVKDWWTKSKYAYLNQPTLGSADPPKRRTSTYVPNCFSYKPIPLYPTSLGVF